MPQPTQNYSSPRVLRKLRARYPTFNSQMTEKDDWLHSYVALQSSTLAFSRRTRRKIEILTPLTVSSNSILSQTLSSPTTGHTQPPRCVSSGSSSHRAATSVSWLVLTATLSTNNSNESTTRRSSREGVCRFKSRRSVYQTGGMCRGRFRTSIVVGSVGITGYLGRGVGRGMHCMGRGQRGLGLGGGVEGIREMRGTGMMYDYGFLGL